MKSRRYSKIWQPYPAGYDLREHISQIFQFSVRTPKMTRFRLILTYGLTILNNSQLTNVTFISELELHTDEQTHECSFQIENNEKLDAGKLCSTTQLNGMFRVRVSGNSKNCGCNGYQINTDTLHTFLKCKVTYGLVLTNITESDLSALSNIKEVRGLVDIQMTNLKNLSVLRNLKEIYSKNGEFNENVCFNVQNNPEMTRLAMPALKELFDAQLGPFIMNLRDLHPEFCITYDEMKLFMEKRVYFINIDAKYCTEDNLTIGAGDEGFVVKLTKVSHLFGSLTIRNTLLEDIEFLSQLEFIAVLDNVDVIQIVSNQNLNFVYFPWMSVIITRYNRTVVIDKNPKLTSPELSIFNVQYATRIAIVGDSLGKGFLPENI
ncbi:Receptor L-domain domain-containing protein [Caenorhabditis elegans]|uniref:Receptor L-domain domain-containing protein n=1 Tax=Caenorhabditis elegans TaxID=6239 RepID=Q9U8C5_CAEEL|nr:Receptor L-domain domain-containing protein [Caenorhabditis elegans]CCD72782.2 Receptor L-domain domain-containing protein [Caenorhabditis elegans]|eukprot:NP_001317763.1 Insulin/EGF-Receptor L Domain protein [Caenorhabditis elegans]